MSEGKKQREERRREAAKWRVIKCKHASTLVTCVCVCVCLFCSWWWLPTMVVSPKSRTQPWSRSPSSSRPSFLCSLRKNTGAHQHTMQRTFHCPFCPDIMQAIGIQHQMLYSWQIITRKCK